MAIGLTATKPFAEKCRPLRTFIAKYMHAKIMAALRHKNQLDALMEFTYISMHVSGIWSWPYPVNRMEIIPMVFRQQVIELA